ncbi:MAG: hypothetical protein LUC33_04725 [Prevotellaceae bacterium]|nr:hypothetical protein [Prevotellaceae bacterium]
MDNQGKDNKLMARISMALSGLRELSHERKLERLDEVCGTLETFLWDVRGEAQESDSVFNFSDAALLLALQTLVMFKALIEPVGDALMMAKAEREKRDGQRG